MLHLFFDDKPWFTPKSHGLGSGMPIAWQGWMLLALHLALVAGVTFLFIDRPFWMAIAIMIAAFLPMPLYAAKTRGGWKWRWGNDEDKGKKK